MEQLIKQTAKRIENTKSLLNSCDDISLKMKLSIDKINEKIDEIRTIN
jgi:phage shock protein A